MLKAFNINIKTKLFLSYFYKFKKKPTNIKIKLLLRYFCVIIFLPITIFIALLIKLLRPLILIRWSHLHNTRIGHFAANVEIYLLKKKFGIDMPDKNYIDFFYKPGLESCNKQLEKMWNSKLNIMPWFIIFPLEFLRRKNILFKEENHFVTTARDQYNLLDKTSPILSFSPEEKKAGFDFLKKLGLPNKPKFVCLQVRDGEYLSDKKYDSHDYRNCDVENYKSACQFLAEQNIYVFRMGSKVKKKISYANSKIIDYAANNIRTDFLDIFLGSECLFWITTGSGIDNMSKLFRKPVLYSNQSPIGLISTSQKTALIIFKHFFDKITNNELNLDTLKKKNLCFVLEKNEFENKNVIVKENSSNLIESSTKEMYQRYINNFWDPWEETKTKQEKFWNKFPYRKEMHGIIKANISKEFLIKNNDFYN
jgi:putative glycosyltransferase (TIGR04372 family)